MLPDIGVTCSRLGSHPPIRTARHLQVAQACSRLGRRLAVAQGGTPTQQRAGRQKAAAARRGIELISASGKYYCPPAKTRAIFSRCTSPSGNCGRSSWRLYPVAKPIDRIARTPRWWATTQRAICNRGKNLASSEYPYIRQWHQWLRRRGGGRGQAWLEGMRIREAERLKEARALVSTQQARERTHASTHRQIDLWTGRDRRTNPRTITKTHAQTRDGQGGNRRIQHTHGHTDARTRASFV